MVQTRLLHWRPSAQVNLALLRNRNFRFLAASEMFWHIGNQFYLIALPWLVLQLTGDTLTLGQVLLFSGIPRVLLMPVGGALCDRLSPRALLLATNAGRAALLGVLAWCVLAGSVTLEGLCAACFVYGLLEAFLYPARGAVVPLLAPAAQRQQANALAQAVEKLAGLAGPLLAGLLIALSGGTAPTAEHVHVEGAGVALAAVAGATLISVILLAGTTTQPRLHQPRPAEPAPALGASIQQGLVYLWRHSTLRTLALVVAAINLFTTGPLYVGLPLLAQTRLAEGAAALGMLTAALNGGALLGAALAGLLPRPAPRRMGQVLVAALALCGAGLALLAGTSSTLTGALLVLAIGAAVNYVNVTTVTWMQDCTPGALMGRIMGLVTMR